MIKITKEQTFVNDEPGEVKWVINGAGGVTTWEIDDLSTSDLKELKARLNELEI